MMLMLRALFLTTIILVAPVRCALADPSTGPGDNSALKYWQAFATLPRLSEAEGQKLIAECLTMPLDAHAREIVTNSEHALELLHLGAALRACDWGISYHDGYYTRLPHGPAARVLCSLACLRARMRFEEGRSAEAIDDIVAAMTLARHVTQDGTLIVVLLGYSIEPRMSETLALYLPRLEASMLKNLKSRIDDLPPGGRPAQAMKFEERDMDWFLRKIKSAKDEDQLVSLLSLVAAPEGPGRQRQEQGRALLKECGGTAEGVVKFQEELRQCFEQMTKILELPLDQFDNEWKRAEIKRTGNPLFKQLFGAFPRLRRAQARMEVRRALLSAALEVQAGGPDGLKKISDPFSGGPFEYAAFDGGFELRSKLTQTDDKPLSLTVGRRAK
jgi:hypothetical protein